MRVKLSVSVSAIISFTVFVLGLVGLFLFAMRTVTKDYGIFFAIRLNFITFLIYLSALTLLSVFIFFRLQRRLK